MIETLAQVTCDYCGKKYKYTFNDGENVYEILRKLRRDGWARKTGRGKDKRRGDLCPSCRGEGDG